MAKYTFKQFKAEYPDDDVCLVAILKKRYGDIDCCPQCGVVSKLTRIAGRRAFACSAGCHTYPCAGTIFEKSSTPLTLWFHAMYLMTATRNGVSAKELERQLGVTYKCAWRIGHEIRKLMGERNAESSPLTGHVEIDETYVGGKVKGKGHRYVGNKTIVMGLAQRDGPFIGQIVPNNKKKSLMPIILEHVAPGTTVSTDTLSAYKLIGTFGFNHGSVNHMENEWVRGIHHTNRIEGFWSHLKKGIRSTRVHVSRKYLQNYVEEFGFRFTHRKEPQTMFDRMLSHLSQPQKSAN